jgi:transcription termination factor Rho
MGAKKQRQPLQKATVIETAQVKPKDSLKSLDRGILTKIQKCLSRARHKSITESEAKAALFVAQKLIAQYNVSQADLVASSNDGSKAQYGGMSKVTIVNVKNRTRHVVKETICAQVGRGYVYVL